MHRIGLMELFEEIFNFQSFFSLFNFEMNIKSIDTHHCMTDLGQRMIGLVQRMMELEQRMMELERHTIGWVLHSCLMALMKHSFVERKRPLGWLGLCFRVG